MFASNGTIITSRNQRGLCFFSRVGILPAVKRMPLGKQWYDAIVCPVVLAEVFVLACASENTGLWFVQGEIFETGRRPVVWQERGLWNQGLEVEGSDGPRG